MANFLPQRISSHVSQSQQGNRDEFGCFAAAFVSQHRPSLVFVGNLDFAPH